jgi:hypothetical protein
LALCPQCYHYQRRAYDQHQRRKRRVDLQVMPPLLPVLLLAFLYPLERLRRLV